MSNKSITTAPPTPPITPMSSELSGPLGGGSSTVGVGSPDGSTVGVGTNSPVAVIETLGT